MFQIYLESIRAIGTHYFVECFIWILECQEEIWSTNSIHEFQTL